MDVKIHRRGGIGGVTETEFGACRVLMLEPAVGAARLLGDMLTQDLKVGAVKRVTTLPDALKVLSAGDFNILITDWSRQTDALKLLSALRGEKSFNRTLPVVVSTANSGTKNMRQLRDAGADEVLTKPFTMRILRSRLQAVARPGRPFVDCSHFFGPDRRRFRKPFEGAEQRRHANCANPDRRKQAGSYSQSERRQGYPGFRPVDRRATNVRAKIQELEGLCEGLDLPKVLALRRITLADPKFADPKRAADLDDFFTVQLLSRLDNFSFERLEEIAPQGFEPLLAPGSEAERAKDRDLLHHLTRHILR